MRAYYLTVVRSTGGAVLVEVMDVLRPVDKIVKYLQNVAGPSITLGNSAGNTNIELFNIDTNNV